MERQTKEMLKGICIISLQIVVMFIIGICLISSTSAIYAGECMEVPLGDLNVSQDIIYMVVGNSSNLDGMNIILNETNESVSVCFAVNYKPDTFTIVFLNNLTKEIVKEVHHYSSGGSSKTIYIENKTTEYIEVDNYIDREVYIDKEIYPEKDINYKSSEGNISPSVLWYYLYGFLLVCFILWIYFWIKMGRDTVVLEEKEDVTTQ